MKALIETSVSCSLLRNRQTKSSGQSKLASKQNDSSMANPASVGVSVSVSDLSIDRIRISLLDTLQCEADASHTESGTTDTSDSAAVVADRLLHELRLALPIEQITPELLKRTQIGIALNKVAKRHTSNKIAAQAKAILDEWKTAVAGVVREPCKLDRETKSLKRIATLSDSGNEALSASKNDETGSRQNENHKRARSTKNISSESKNEEQKYENRILSSKSTHFVLGKTNDTQRNRIQKLVHEGLCMNGDPGELGVEMAVRIEQCLFDLYKCTDSKYKSKYREIGMNLKDPKNPDLREDILSGMLSPEDLVIKPITELASKEMKAQREKDLKELWDARRTDWNLNKGMTDMFRCGKCGQRKCTYYQMQTRSADEPMTTFVRCTVCGNRWKC